MSSDRGGCGYPSESRYYELVKVKFFVYIGKVDNFNTDLFQAHQGTPASQQDLLYDPSRN